ncbi:T9SS type A sorting domain-containing protein [Flammeovirga agarivorans]|uniref:T9SS type A sorting domain-containing protein n=1 Tax=Flammeovirga agarivorans TaxID=2726742 RepID=A0A7X8SGR4_9BACT|nr:T9SS type A sorting domain-containing protein [Flammeovirga agarivorans]NLR89916.1 T9SS type A sorting domain-containing protein [Flammeovirga agarivorans]
MQRTFLILICLTYLNLQGIYAQNIGFTNASDIQVIKENVAFNNAWNGGINAPQFFNLDLNLDNTDDLVLFDRTTRKISTYLFQNNQWEYAPEYEVLFPQDIRFWIQLVDFNDNGKKDLIIGEEDGIYIYPNNSSSSTLSFSDLPTQLETTTFSGSPTPLTSALADSPTFADVDGDGLIDFLTFVPGLGGTIEAHINQGIEEGIPSFRKRTDNWGDFQECGDCATYVFGDDNCTSNGRIQHLGSALTMYDVNGNGNLDLLIGERSCTNLVALPNKGSNENASFDESITFFPQSHPVSFPDFPVAFFVDTDNDGLEDMIIAPNIDTNEGDLTDFSKYVWRYKNTGTMTSPAWTFQEDNFIQNTGIDLGERSRPITYDVDNDGKLDLLIGYRISFDNEGNSSGGGISYYKNIGSNTSPEFQWITDNFLNIQAWGMLDISPQIIQWKNTTQLAISGRVPNSNQAGVYLFSLENDFEANTTPERIFEHRPEDIPYFVDIDADGLIDVLLGKFSGALEYHHQNTNGTFELQEESFLNIEGNILRKYPSAFVSDLNNDGRDDLLVWDDSGTPRVWQNFRSENPTYQSKAFFNDEKFIDRTYGNRLKSTQLGDYLITGSEGGGLYLAKIGQYDQPTAVENPTVYSKLKVFPNPTSQQINIKNEYATLVNGRIYNQLGQLMLTIEIESNQTINIRTDHWQRGLYILQIYQAQNQIQVSKIIVQ